MGSSNNDFVKYPRTPHLFGSQGTSDDKHMGEEASLQFISDPSLLVEEKIDGTNVGIHFRTESQMSLQCRGHLITAGMHSQYDLFKQWAEVKRGLLFSILKDRFILYGEWVYATHSIHYTLLPHYFFEFDIYDKADQRFLDYQTRMKILDGTGLKTVPIVHTGPLTVKQLPGLIIDSTFGSQFEHPVTGKIDKRMEGLYLRTEDQGEVSGRSKFVRPEFTEKVKQSSHWQNKPMKPNLLKPDASIWT